MAVEDQDVVIEEVSEVEEEVGETSENPTETEEETETVETEETEAGNSEVTTEETEDEVVVTIGEESPPQDDEVAKAPEWVRELRKTNREQARKIRELEESTRAKEPENNPVTLGAKPTLEDCDYDGDVFESKLSAWHDDKIKYDKAQSEMKNEQDNQAKQWTNTLENYATAKNNLKVRDYEEAEAVVESTLSHTQQGMILQGADNPALIVYALGKNSKRAKEISEIKDPVKFAFAVAKLETQLKVSNRKTTPSTKPEKTVSGNANISGAVDSTLEKLRESAAKSGDYSRVVAYKKTKKKG